MTIICPNCHSSRVGVRNFGRTTCGTVGSVAGAHLAMQGIQMGTTVGRFFGPPGIVIGGTAGLIIAGISGAMLGGKAGTELGAMIDNNILKNYKCMDCHHTFGESNSQLENETESEFTSDADEGDTFQLPSHYNHIHRKE
tara:strand:+ start:8266 stop:8685 length:420 start_codon:yes stop_codon:yes gene_type:complete